jgi:hypothetical protein
LAQEIKSHSAKIEIQEAQVGCVLATQSGPKPLGVAYVVGWVIRECVVVVRSADFSRDVCYDVLLSNFLI